MDKTDKIMAAAYVAMCVGVFVVYQQYVKRSEAGWEAVPDEIFEHIDRIIEQRFVEATVAQKAAEQ